MDDEVKKKVSLIDELMIEDIIVFQLMNLKKIYLIWKKLLISILKKLRKKRYLRIKQKVSLNNSN
tara:strand:- start:76 stop:270 length:195 start_codon:yes stop_codon:yes gene_type:complete